ncbi:MAG: hypothetical protein LBM64_05445 [Deltaproteobacteria bacterium]|jgi:hypothetical protein|nr:hypothetical protein [Deltaproteobacteria bacterium]
MKFNKATAYLGQALCLSLCLFLAGSCAPGGARLASRQFTHAPADSVSRADPGYIQYMEKLSMLGQSHELADIVSGSNLSWRAGGSEPTPAVFLQRAGVWVRIHPQTVLAPGRLSPLSQLGGPVFWSSLQKGHINGLYLAPLGGAGGLWDYEGGRSYSGNDDVAQFDLARHIGTEDDYKAVIRSAQNSQALTGAALAPAAPGVGPDFFLAVRDVRAYPGLYCMVEVPREQWSMLSSLKSGEWSLEELSSTQTAQLERYGIAPTSFRQDKLSFLDKSGWGATSEVRGLDGNMRRWVYRYYGDYKRPVLNWADPSSTARQVLSGSVIRQVGMLGNGLSGYSVAPFIGLERDDALSLSGAVAAAQRKNTYSMALSASLDLARQIRSYGGWSWLSDQLPLPVMQMFLESGPDFVMDGVTSPAAEHALLSGDAALLRFMLDEAMRSGLDFRRLVHYSTGHEGISYKLPHLQYLRDSRELVGQRAGRADAIYRRVLDQARQPRTPAPGRLAGQLPAYPITTAGGQVKPPAQPSSQAPAGKRELMAADFENNVLYQTPAGLAAAALGLPLDGDLSESDKAEIRKGHSLLLTFKAMQPGLLMLSGQDLTGAMPLNWTSIYDTEREWKKYLATLGTYPLQGSTRSVVVNALGLPQARNIYGPIDEQTFNPDSFLLWLGELMKLREELGLAGGQMTGQLKGEDPNLVCLVTEVPEREVFVIALYNFTRQPISDTLRTGQIRELAAAMRRHDGKIVYGNPRLPYIGAHELSLTIPAWEAVIIKVGK